MVPRTYDLWVTKCEIHPTYIKHMEVYHTIHTPFGNWMIEGHAHPHSKKRKDRMSWAWLAQLQDSGGMPITSRLVSSKIIRTWHDKSKQWYLNRSPCKLKIPNTEGHKLWKSTVFLSSDAVCHWCSGLTHTSKVWSHHLTSWPWFMNMYTKTV